MDFRFENEPAYTTLVAELDKNQSVVAESGAMVSYTQDVEVETEKSDEGLLSSMKKSVLTDESVYVNKYTATSNGQEVKLAQYLPGDITDIELDNESYYIQSGSYIANSLDIDTETSTGSLSSVFGGEGLFFLEASGSGRVFVGSYGGLIRREIEKGEVYTVDSGHAVAWSEDVSFTTEKIGGLKQTLLSGEGLVMRFQGPGVVYMQSRNYDDLISDIASNVPSGGG
jgi:uncharacterized protein (TIGR00266 family)